MATKTKAQQRIERAKQQYIKAEGHADGLLTKLILSPYSLAIVVTLVLCVFGVWLM